MDDKEINVWRRKNIDDIFNTAYPPMVIVTLMMMPSIILMIN